MKKRFLVLVAVTVVVAGLLLRSRFKVSPSTTAGLPPKPDAVASPIAAHPVPVLAARTVPDAPSAAEGVPSRALTLAVSSSPPSRASADRVPTAAPTPSSPLSPPPTIQPQAIPNEVAASRRMYLAHASLRIETVAAPDSAPNRQILARMLGNALKSRELDSAAAPPQK